MSYINDEFFKAVQVGDAKMINELLNCRADIHFKNDYALHWSVQFNTLETSRLLLDRGANVNVNFNVNLETEYFTAPPLRCAISRGNLELVNMLLEYNVDINTRDGIALRLSLDYARRNALNGHTEIVAKLLECGADMRCDNKSILIKQKKILMKQ